MMFRPIAPLLHALLPLLTALTESESANLPATPVSQCYPRCGLNADCNPDRTCSCPLRRPLGDPGFICYSPVRAACFAFGDPRVTGFNGEKSRIMFPCKITVAQFDTPMHGYGNPVSAGALEKIERFSGSDPKPNRCRVVVESTTRMSPGGQYFTESMDIKLVVNRRGAAESIWIHLEAGNVNFQQNGGFLKVLGPRDCETLQVDKSSVTICHKESKGLWQVAAPDCGDTEIVFRPWDMERENQLEVVGFGILTQEDADYSDAESKYPYSICHVPPPYGSGNWYLEFYHVMGLATRYGSFLYSFLLYPPREAQPDPLCEDLTTIFSDCPTPRHVRAVNVCSPILIKYAMCAVGNDQNPLVAFKTCMNGICGGRAARELCADAHKMVSGKTCPDTPALKCF